jgi:hypothetical protein
MSDRTGHREEAARRSREAATEVPSGDRGRCGSDGHVDAINSARAERVAAQAEINNTPAPNLMDLAEVYARIDSFGDVSAKLNDAKGEGLAELGAARMSSNFAHLVGGQGVPVGALAARFGVLGSRLA